MALSRVLCPTLVGRESELSRLEDALLSALRGDGGVVIVGGEAGTGKTRLVAALAERASRLGCAVVSGACSEAELALPYLPFLEAIGNHLATEDLGGLKERLGPAADELAQMFPQMGRPVSAGADASQAKLRLFESILLLLRDASRKRALLVILEDLQWADPATRELLDYATRRLRSTNVLVVATYRSDDLHRKHPLLPTIQGWRRSGNVDLIELQPLGATAVGDMVCAIFEEDTITDEFRDFLSERSEGNPFVLEEMLRDALDRGDIFLTDKGWDRKPVAEMRIPRTVTDAILQRLERLNRDDVAVLSAASVMGRAFDVTALAAVAGVNESAVHTALENSVTAQLIEEVGSRSGRYWFRHALTREAIYEDLVTPRRQQLHSRVADALKAASGTAPVDLAHHLFMAGRNDEAVAMCVAAARDAAEALAFHDAAELFQKAAPFVHDPVERGRLLCRAGDAYWSNAESDSARGVLEHGIADLEVAGLAVEAAGYRLLLGRCHWELLRTDRAREQFERARDVLEEAGPSEALAIAYIRLSGLAMFDNLYPESLRHAERAADTARLAGSDLALCWSWNFMGGAEVGLGRVEAGLRHLDDSYQSAMNGGYRFQAFNAVYNAAWMSLHLGRDPMPWSDRNLARERFSALSVLYVGGMLALQRGQVVEALSLARAAGQKARDAGHQKQVWRCAVLLAHVLAENLQAESASTEMPPLSSRVESQDSVYDGAPRIRAKLAADDPAGAFQMARSIAPQACELGSPADIVAEAAGGDPAWLRRFLDGLPVRDELLSSPRLAAARGRLALYEGRVDDALGDLRRAVAGFERAGYMLDASSAELSPADTLDRIGSLQRWATQEVSRRHGTVDKFAGDAVMATFNISGQSVDHTAQALRAALAIIDKAALAGLPVGPGVAVGPAVVGSLTEAGNVSVLGEVTNLAARLQAAAAAGEVILSGEAFRRVGGWLDEQHLKAEQVELGLKGLAEADRIVVVDGVSSVGSIPIETDDWGIDVADPVVAYRLAAAVVAPAPV